MNNIIVTGAAGYIGSNAVIQLLTQTNANVIAVDRRKVNHNIPSHLKHRYSFYKLDIGDAQMNKVFRNKNIQGVLHFAGDISVPESVSNPLKYYDNNVVNTLKFLEMCKKNNVNNFIFSSSAAVYGQPKFTKTKKKATEADPYAPINPYGESKMMVELMLESFSDAWPLFKHCSLRYFNVVGNDPQQRVKDIRWKEKSNLFPSIMRAGLGYTPDIRVFGTNYKTPDGTCIRDYIHVTDLVNAHIIALDKLANDVPINSVYNVGNGKGYSVKEVLNSFGHLTGQPKTIDAPRRAGDAETLIASNSKIKKDLKWKPVHTSLDGMVKDYANMICTYIPDTDTWREKK
jgi:UDP-glucose 4-epimerase